MSTLKQFFFLNCAASTGLIAGRAKDLYAHMQYLRSIENPDGYKRAMKNVQNNLGLPVSGLFLSRIYQISPDDAFPHLTSEHGMITSPGLYLYISKGFS
jgi:hypothetical protein